MNSFGDAGELRRFSFTALALLVLCVATFAPRTPQLGLLHDDWVFVRDVAKGSASVPVPDGLRPLLRLPWRLSGILFGDALPGYYALLFALQWLGAILLYLIARRHGPVGLAAAFAALAMVYPADASHLWLGTLVQRTAWPLALAAIVLAERSPDGGRWMLPAVALGLLSLALYELQFFLLVLWPAVAHLLGAPWRRRRLIAWGSIPALYLAWRFVVLPLRGGPAVVNTELLWDPLEMARRAFLVVPYNLFADGWLIGAVEVVRSPLVVGPSFVLAAAATIPLAARWGAGPAPAPRCFAAALALIALGVAPVVPTTYWMGRSAGTFAARILAAALPGAALLLLLTVARVARRPRARALAFAALITVAFAFHWNIGRLAAENWAVQRRLASALRARASSWPAATFLVVLDLPPNRLAYDTPWGVGRMIQEIYGDHTLSGIGISGERSPGDILSTGGGELLVHGGFYARVPLERVVALRWRAGGLDTVPLPVLLDRLPERR